MYSPSGPVQNTPDVSSVSPWPAAQSYMQNLDRIGGLLMEKIWLKPLAVAKAQNISKASRLLFVPSHGQLSTKVPGKAGGHGTVQRSKGIRATRLTENGRRLLPLAQNWLQANEAFQLQPPALGRNTSFAKKPQRIGVPLCQYAGAFYIFAILGYAPDCSPRKRRIASGSAAAEPGRRPGRSGPSGIPGSGGWFPPGTGWGRRGACFPPGC